MSMGGSATQLLGLNPLLCLWVADVRRERAIRVQPISLGFITSLKKTFSHSVIGLFRSTR
ncbi:hypothetical protein DPEC_G00213860 [Dallia pectoralis]|uniref:Uncharacterized protein n=1 Tax=Dallia pectoralis TaxID=75939 RepID=A0ACC2G6V0_DALPE|nr:hypothetical protein DPEC_G00213860 [Dallia pectoralis]